MGGGGSNGGCSCFPTIPGVPSGPALNQVLIGSYIKNIHVYPQCGRLIRMGYAPLAIVIDFLYPMNAGTFTLNRTFTTGGISITPAGFISGFQFTSGSFDATDTELTLWINTSQMGYDDSGKYHPQVLYTLVYNGGLQTQSGIPLNTSVCFLGICINISGIYSFEAVGSLGGIATIKGYEYGERFGAVSGLTVLAISGIIGGIATFWGWLNGVQTTSQIAVPDADYMNVPPHYPFTTNFYETLLTPVETVLEQKDSSGNFAPVDGSAYVGYNNIMFGDWISTFTTLLPYTYFWPGAEPFSYTIASANGLDIDTIYKLTYPTVKCDMPSGLEGNQDLMGDPVGAAVPIPNCTPSFGNSCISYYPADQSVTFHTSPIRIDNPQSDNVNIPTITAPFSVYGVGTSDIASVTITSPSNDILATNVTVGSTTNGIGFTTTGIVPFTTPGTQTLVTTGYNVTGTSRGSDFVTINYQPAMKTVPFLCEDYQDCSGQPNCIMKQPCQYLNNAIGPISALDAVLNSLLSSCNNGTYTLGGTVCPNIFNNIAYNVSGGIVSVVWDNNPLHKALKQVSTPIGSMFSSPILPFYYQYTHGSDFTSDTGGYPCDRGFTVVTYIPACNPLSNPWPCVPQIQEYPSPWCNLWYNGGYLPYMEIQKVADKQIPTIKGGFDITGYVRLTFDLGNATIIPNYAQVTTNSNGSISVSIDMDKISGPINLSLDAAYPCNCNIVDWQLSCDTCWQNLVQMPIDYFYISHPWLKFKLEPYIDAKTHQLQFSTDSVDGGSDFATDDTTTIASICSALLNVLPTGLSGGFTPECETAFTLIFPTIIANNLKANAIKISNAIVKPLKDYGYEMSQGIPQDLCPTQTINGITYPYSLSSGGPAFYQYGELSYAPSTLDRVFLNGIDTTKNNSCINLMYTTGIY